MRQVFHPSMNTLSRVSIFGAVFFVAAAILLAWLVVRSPYVTRAKVVQEQPVPFSHQHHVSDCGIDCRYCHTSVEDSPYAGMPATEICMQCHSYLFADAEMLEPVRASYRNGEPIPWNRVHDIDDFADFKHDVHVHKGIGCVTCHGRVDEMPLMWREHSLHMEWCLECHRHPAKYVRPREFTYVMEELDDIAKTEEFRDYLATAHPDLDPQDENVVYELRARLADEYDLESETNCSVCHY